MSERRLVSVAIGIVWRAGRLLITRRPAGSHLGELWEFPGGKVEPGETPEAAAERELLEEVGLGVRAVRRRNTIRHAYADREVELIPIDCESDEGEPKLLGVSAARWVTTFELADYEFPAANQELLETLRGERH